ncbi:MAG: YihY/virulence factor BrkB family protein [Dehalococcoidia bacterium]|nr:YihY/virulence factor BrkB family protein [Dehalococcoidia bacterium]
MAAVLDKIPEWHVGRFDVTGIGKATVKDIMLDDVLGLAAQMSYAAILSIFPFLLLLAGITSVIDRVFALPNLGDTIVNQSSGVLPTDVQGTLRRFTDQISISSGRSWTAIVLGLAGSAYSASSAVQTVIKGLNRAYEAPSRAFVRGHVLALELTALFALMILAGTLLFGSGAWFSGGVGGLLGWGAAFTALWNVLSPIVAALLVMSAVALLYWQGPNTDVPWKSVIPGALFFVIGWVIFSIGFGYYVGNFGSYNKVYGSVAAVIVLLVWLYWTNTLLLIGGELNAVIERRNGARTARSRAADRGGATATWHE